MLRLRCIFRTGKLFTVCIEGPSFSCADNFIQRRIFHRLHIETNCGRHRSWSCIQCNLLTADGYNEHMETQHKLAVKEEDTIVVTKIEDTLNESETISSIENVIEAVSIYDPLHMELKEENHVYQDTGNGALNDGIDDGTTISNIPAEKNSSKK